MRFPRCASLLVLALAVGCGTTPEIPEDATAEDVFAMAEERREAGELGAAQSLYETVYEDYPSSPRAEPAQWLAAEMAFRDEEYVAAREILTDYHDIHPVSRLGDLGERLYEIGRRLYEEGRSGLLGIGLLPTSSQAITTMEWITVNLQTGARADDAYLFLARVRMAESSFEEATADLAMLLENYPESEWALEARFLLGEAWLALNRGPAYDLESLVRARSAFEGYVREVEKSEARRQDHAGRLAEAKEKLAEANARLARKNLVIAEFYESVERPAAAAIYLRATVRDYPGTEAAAEAEGRLAEIEAPGE